MESIKFEPISQYVWVFKKAVKKIEEKTASGIILDAAVKEVAQETGIVAGIGILCEERVQKVLRVGDTIMFEGTAQKGKIVDGQEFLLIQDRHVMAKL